MSRPETGPMQFGDDWPGVFIRGDNAFGYAQALESILFTYKVSDLNRGQVQGLLNLLRSSNVHMGSEPQMLKDWEDCRAE